MPTIKYYSHFTIMPNKLLLTYKFRVFFSPRNDRRRQLFLDINNAMLVLFFGFNYVQAGDSRAPLEWLESSKLNGRRAPFNIHSVIKQNFKLIKSCFNNSVVMNKRARGDGFDLFAFCCDRKLLTCMVRERSRHAALLLRACSGLLVKAWWQVNKLIYVRIYSKCFRVPRRCSL